jgi:hypothetical protein
MLTTTRAPDIAHHTHPPHPTPQTPNPTQASLKPFDESPMTLLDQLASTQPATAQPFQTSDTAILVSTPFAPRKLEVGNNLSLTPPVHAHALAPPLTHHMAAAPHSVTNQSTNPFSSPGQATPPAHMGARTYAGAGFAQGLATNQDQSCRMDELKDLF